MARRTKRQRKPTEEYTTLAVLVQEYDASVDAAVNFKVHNPEFGWRFDEDDPLYTFTTRLSVVGKSTYPEARADQIFELTIYGDDAPSLRNDVTLKDVQAVDDRRLPVYRQYRGREVPVLIPPHGLALLHKVRGEPRWTCSVFVPPRFVRDALILLG